MGSLHIPESSCSYLLQELKLIWDEVGSDQLERERILLELEQECLEVYKRKVDSANIRRSRLHQALADSEAEFTNLLISLGERSFAGRPEKLTGTLKEQLDTITPALQEMQLRKEVRVNQFKEVQDQIQMISSEIEGHSDHDIVIVNEADLSLKKLEEYQNELQRLHREKNDRLKKAEEYTRTVHDLAATMGMDSAKIITEVHPSLESSNSQHSKNISDSILDRLNHTVALLKDEKMRRLEKLHRLGKALSNLWNLMDTPIEEQQMFTHITKFSASEATGEIPGLGSLTLDTIHEVEAEVERLDQLKASKMKELFLKKKVELEEICKKSHMEMPSSTEMDHIMKLIISGEMDHADLLTSMDERIYRAREEACSRKDIMEKVERWLGACNEERWLEEYNMDENRYSVRRGGHRDLKRAERARIIVNKIPALVELLIAKARSWEEERKKTFLYDEVPLLAMLKEYNLSRQEKEEEKQRQREKKRVQSQIPAEADMDMMVMGSRPSTSSKRIPNRSLNSTFITAAAASTPNTRPCSGYGGIKKLGSSNNPLTHGTSPNTIFRESKKMQIRRMLAHYNHGCSPITADVVSEISATFSGPTSP
ncbi:Microtubule-associated protein MAP65/Ase1/PRC1 protein [Dioscorea alata]|uniref:Microtubule-associated protein MAP65/Ase1/PRC1 protein n=1 Tax=Dioscorea alata TaxID=55571 RepID=A0ACB7UTM2_DIOAL|nr:Microtubule-associated protein MAP65/Ase1/PRC1 protein [Dioscorea alata]